MSFIDKIKDIVGVGDEYEEEEMDIVTRDHNQVAFDRDTDNDYPTKSNKVVNIHATAQLQVVLVKPEKFLTDASTIADHLSDKRTVILNCESTNKEEAGRLVDFLAGVAYANDGNIKRISNNTYIITPYNVNISGDFIGELENNGMFF
ncbi:MAG: cell division protein SepF [Clostridiales bacterium]|nr:cell division protein SepF [Clostridiales bacterium]